MNLKKKNTKTTQMNIGGKTFDDDKDVATTFNDLFVNVGQVLRIQFRKSRIYHQQSF